MQPSSPTFADHRPFNSASGIARLKDIVGPKNLLLEDEDFIEQCLTFHSTLEESQASDREKHEFFINYVRMMVTVKSKPASPAPPAPPAPGPSRLHQPDTFSEADLDDFQKFIQEQDSKIAQLEQEREWLREENKRRKPERSTFLTTDEMSKPSAQSSDKFDMFSSKINISQVIEESSGYQDSQFLSKPSGESSHRSEEKPVPRNKKSLEIALDDSSEMGQSQMSIQEAYSKRYGKKAPGARTNKKSPLKREKSKEELIELRKSMMQYRKGSQEGWGKGRDETKPDVRQEKQARSKGSRDNRGYQRSKSRPERHGERPQARGRQSSTEMMSRLIKGERAKIDPRQAREDTKRRYNELPEVKKRLQEELREAEQRERLQRKQEYERRVSGQRLRRGDGIH